MTQTSRWLGAVAAVALAASAGCSGAETAGSSAALSPTSLSLAQGVAPAASSIASSLVADFAGGFGGRIHLSDVDSLIVHVSSVEVLPESLLVQCFPPMGDPQHGFRPMPPDRRPDSLPPPPAACAVRGRGTTAGPLDPGPGGGRFTFPPIPPDSLCPDSGWGRREDQWYTLDVQGDGHLDLLHLPADSASALMLASGDLPAGDYGAARLFLSDATIWFNTPIIAGADTLKADTGYSVRLPRLADRMGFVTDAGFTVPEGGGTVSLIFDANATLAGAVVTDSGQVVIVPILAPRHPR